MEFFDGCGVGLIWSTDEGEDILVVLEFGRHVSCNISFFFKCKILCFVCRGEGVTGDFAFTTIRGFVADVVAREVLQSLAMADEHRVCEGNWLTLLFQTIIGIGVVDDPL